jgi:membrane-bound metal-dependent hydrolase YbcI (DUF457 family)
MDVLAHFVFGLWLYTKFNSLAVLPLSVILDIDHLIGFIYDKRKAKKIKIPSLLHLAYRPRSWLHSIIGILLIGLPLVPLLGLYPVLIPLLSHLLIDMLDKAGIYMFPPFTRMRVHGILPASYLPEENPSLKGKRSHVPSIVLIVATAILVFLHI